MGGLARFDGVNFTVFNSDNTPALGPNEITAVAADPGGGLWIGTNGAGVLRFLNGKFTQVAAISDLPSDSVRVLIPDSRGSSGSARIMDSPSTSMEKSPRFFGDRPN